VWKHIIHKGADSMENKTKKKMVSKKQAMVEAIAKALSPTPAPQKPRFFGMKFQGAWGVTAYESVPAKSLWGTSGLKSHRGYGEKEKKPTHHCSNCGKDRYSACKCSVKGVVAVSVPA
jgi:hypothetical protein